MAMRYTFSDAATFKGWKDADPQVIGETLELIASKSGGRLLPSAVVAEARKPRHPLHSYFEWRDKHAAEQYRLDQARFLIRSVRIVAPDDDEPRMAFLNITDKGGAAYHHHNEVVGSRQLQLAVMQQAERDLMAWEKRYAQISDICVLVRSARERLSDNINHESGLPH